MLEVGGGLGVLSRVPRRAHARTCTSSSSTAAWSRALRDALDPHANTTLHLADAVKLDLDALDPPPDQGRRQPALRRRRDRDPPDDRARERRRVGGDGAEGGRRALRGRRRARRAYGVPSVLAQLACDVRVGRKIPRGVFIPVPNVDSVLVGLKRHGPAPPREPAHARPARLRPPPQGARAARSRSRPAPTATSATAPARRWRRSASPPTPAPSRSAPADWRALWERLCVRRSRPARSTSACSSARRAPTACTRSSRSSSRPTWPTRSRSSRAATVDEVDLPRRRRREPRAARAARSSAPRPAGTAPPLRLDDRQADPDRGRAWRAGRATPPPRCGSPRRPPGFAIPPDAADAPRRRRDRDAARPSAR